MKRIGNGWRPSSSAPTALLTALVLAILLGACSGSAPPEDVVDAYFSETKRGDVRQALEMWELSALGPAPVDLDPGQQSIRLESRRELAEALTEALSMAGDNLRWERSGLVLYDIRDGVASVTDDLDEANVATVQVDLSMERSDGPALEEELAITLWRSADGGWRVTGLDKGLPVLEDFLKELRGSG
jgi:hypothetical protein